MTLKKIKSELSHIIKEEQKAKQFISQFANNTEPGYVVIADWVQRKLRELYSEI